MVFILTQKEEDYRNNYIRLIFSKGFYVKRNYSRNGLIEMLATVFNDQGSGVTVLKKQLLDDNSRGMFGELFHLRLTGNKAVMEYSTVLVDDPEETAVEIDRNILIQLATNWQSLVYKEVPEILIYCKNNEYFVADTLPEGID